MPSAPKRFRISSKSYFITYQQCSLSKEDALSQLKHLHYYPISPKYIRVAQEQHQDGNGHLHVLIQFQSKYLCTNHRFFDLASPTTSAHFHPNNIQGARSSPDDVQTYISKHGDFTEFGKLQIDGRSATERKPPYAYALNASNKAEALQIIRERNPKSFILQYCNINSMLDRIFAPAREAYVSRWDPTSFRVPDDFERWVGVNIVARPDKPVSIVIEGPSRIGKTEWARSLNKNHNYLSGYLDFGDQTYSNDAIYNVIDNVYPKDLLKKYWKELIGAQRDWQAKCKYSKPARIKGGIPSIILCDPDNSFRDFLEKGKNRLLKEWTLAHAEFYFIEEPLFKIRRSKEVPSQPERQRNDSEDAE